MYLISDLILLNHSTVNSLSAGTKFVLAYHYHLKAKYSAMSIVGKYLWYEIQLLKK